MTLLLVHLLLSCRPDFLSRCVAADDMLAVNAADTLNGLQLQPGCTNMDIKKLEDGRMSFPSGHSSCSMAVGLFAALYMLWSLHWREGGALHSSLLRPASSFIGRIGKDVASLVVLLVLLFQIAWPWGVALSRFRDNRHNASDVVGGLLLAVSFVPVFVARLASSVSYQVESGEWSTPEQQEQEQREQEQQLLEQEEQQQQQQVQQQVAIHPLPEPVLPKYVAQQHPVFALPRPAAEQHEVQLTIKNGGAPQESDASSAVTSSCQAASDLTGQALPAVAGGAGSV
jgi:membrane-associated phospholipid phosphatase